MKLSSFTLALVLPVLALPAFTAAAAETELKSNAPHVYINEKFGFNVKGYKYAQKEFPCNIDKILVEDLVSRSKQEGIFLEPVSTAKKVNNGVIPVLAIDIEQLVLGEAKFGTSQDTNLPKVQITAALIKGKDNFVTAKHTCAIVSLNEFSPSSDITDLGSYGVTVCKATRKCLQDLSKDVVEWYAPQIH